MVIYFYRANNKQTDRRANMKKFKKAVALTLTAAMLIAATACTNSSSEPKTTYTDEERKEINSYARVLIPEDVSDDAAIKERITKTYADVNDTVYEYPVYVLKEFGIMSGENDTIFGVDTQITAGEFLEIVKKAFDTNEFKTSVYNDLSADPSKTITDMQATAIILSALGYDEDAQKAGGYPSGYRDVGNKLCVSRGLNVYESDTATRGLVAMLMYNAVGTEIKSTGKSLFENKYRKTIQNVLTENDIQYLLQDNFYYRVEAYNVYMRKGVSPLQITSFLLDLFENGTREQKKRAARALSDNQEPQSYFKKKSENLYVTLSQIGLSSRLATANLMSALKNEKENIEVRIYALRAIWMMNIDDIIPMEYWILALRPETLSYSQMLLNKASDKLEMTNTEESVNALIKALQNPNREVVIRAIDTLNRKAKNVDLVEKAKDAIPELKKLLKNKDTTIAHQAAVAVNTFGEEADLPDMKKAGAFPAKDGKSELKVVKADDLKIVIDNGIFEVTFDAKGNQGSGGFSSLKVHSNADYNLVKQNDVSWKQTDKPDRSGYSRDIAIVEQTDDVIEVSCKFPHNEIWSYDLDFRYRIMKGESKIYEYIILEQPEDGFGTGTGQLQGLIHMRIDKAIYDYNISSEKLLGQKLSNPTYGTTPNNEKAVVEQATDLGTSGEVEGKFIWWQGSADTRFSGHVSNMLKLGFWQLYPSYESFPGNTLRTNLNEITMDMSSLYIESQYFDWTGFQLPAGRYTKVYCPWVWYINTGDSMIDMMEDAKAQLAKEEAMYPYEWVDSDHYYDRGDVTGKVVMADGTSAKGAYVMVNVYGGREDSTDDKGVFHKGFAPQWQQNKGPYHYWTRIDNDEGVYEIKDVHSGEYNVTVFKDGYTGTFYLPEMIKVEKGKTTTVDTVTFADAKHGSLAWRVGEPTGTWLYDAEDVYDFESTIELEVRHPLNIVYKVDEADPRYDWYTYGRGYKGAVPNKIIFNKDSSVTSDALITVATGSVRTNVTLGVRVNGYDVGEFKYEYNYTDDSQCARTFAYGRLQYNEFRVDNSLLKDGENVVEIEIRNDSGYFIYDFVQMEYLDGGVYEQSLN